MPVLLRYFLSLRNEQMNSVKVGDKFYLCALIVLGVILLVKLTPLMPNTALSTLR